MIIIKVKEPYIDLDASTLVQMGKAVPIEKIDITFTKKLIEQLAHSFDVSVFSCSFDGKNKISLYAIEKAKLILTWESTYASNIAFDDEVDLDGFPNGYCFFPELWKASGSKILLLYYSH